MNWNFVYGIAYITFFFGFACASIGQRGSGEPFSWYLPVSMFLITSTPFLLGYLAGKWNR
jgi:hypothetical protein